MRVNEGEVKVAIQRPIENVRVNEDVVNVAM